MKDDEKTVVSQVEFKEHGEKDEPEEFEAPLVRTKNSESKAILAPEDMNPAPRYAVLFWPLHGL